MSLVADFRLARENVKAALNMTDLEADQWMIKQIGIRVSGAGYYKKIHPGTPDASILINKLAGTHGRTLVKIIEARSKSK